MADPKAPVLDQNGRPMVSEAAKWLAPPVPPEDLTRVVTGPGPLQYEYVDPASLFAMERLIAIWRQEGKVVKSKGKGFKPFVRDVAERAFPYWPQQGYLLERMLGKGAYITDVSYPAAAPVAVPPPPDPGEDGFYPAVDDAAAAPPEGGNAPVAPPVPAQTTVVQPPLPPGLPGLPVG